MTQRELHQRVWGDINKGMQTSADKQEYAYKMVNLFEDARCAGEAEWMADIFNEKDALNVIKAYGIKTYIECVKSGKRFFLVGANKEFETPIECDPIEQMISLKYDIVDYIIKGEPCEFVDMQQIWNEVYDEMPTE